MRPPSVMGAAPGTDPQTVERRATILVVDDEPVNRALIKGLLRRQFDVIEAASGAEAVQRARGEAVDLVVMDINMPEMDGFQATPLLKAAAGERFLPVILMTASNEEALLTEGLGRGADDFLLKPVSRTLLEAKVNALLRVAGVFRVLREQNRELAQRRARAERDYEIARGVFDRVTRRSRFDLPDLIVHGLSLDTFNGDIVLATLAGRRLRLLVGDFAGHGLGAAVGALPASEVFFAMAQRGFGLGDLVRELGEKLYRMFPRDLFLAVCVVDVDLVAGRLLIWNGGLPDVLVLDAAGGIAARVPSQHPPLGVLPGAQVGRNTVEVAFGPGARLAIFSDGLLESRAQDGTMFGIDRVEAALQQGASEPDWIAPLRRAHDDFCGPRAADDDVTFVGLTHTPALAAALADEWAQGPKGHGTMGASVQVRFEPEALRRPEPLGPLLDLLGNPALFGSRAVDAQLVLTELFANAVEHGLLGLDSIIKDAPDGFAAYYRLRDERMAALRAGLVTVSVGLVNRCRGKAIVITVADTGRGFDASEVAPSGLPCTKAGRGLKLVRALAQELEVREGGAIVEAVLALPAGAAP